MQTSRDLTLLQLHGHGFRHLNINPSQITLTSPRQYRHTVPWAEAAYAAGFDGIVWMSRHHNSSRAYVFFAHSGTSTGIEQHSEGSLLRAFSQPDLKTWTG